MVLGRNDLEPCEIIHLKTCVLNNSQVNPPNGPIHYYLKMMYRLVYRILGLARLIVISVNWSIHHRKTIIDEQKETIDYLLLLFCKETYEKLQLYLIFSVFKPSDSVNFPKEEVVIL